MVICSEITEKQCVKQKYPVTHSKMKIWPIIHITRKRCETGCKLALLDSSTWHTGFQLEPTWVTLIDLGRLNGRWRAPPLW